MKCVTGECNEEAEFRFCWPPDGSEQNMCRGHITAMLRLASALCMPPLKVHRIAALEAREDVLRAALAARFRCAGLGTDEDPPELERLYEACDRLISEEARTVSLLTETPATTEEAPHAE
jgi:hypothetical protein